MIFRTRNLSQFSTASRLPHCGLERNTLSTFLLQNLRASAWIVLRVGRSLFWPVASQYQSCHATDMRTESAKGQRGGEDQLTRGALYDLVWVQRILKVAARYGVSSSYMAKAKMGSEQSGGIAR